MPDITQMMMPHWCVVWQKLDNKTKRGQPRVSSPVNVKCRWAESDQASVTQDSMTESFPRNIHVSQEVELGSYVWGEGKITDLPSSPKYLEVVGIEKIPDIKGRHSYYGIRLQKGSSTLPTVV